MFQSSFILIPIVKPKRRFRKKQRSWKRTSKRIHQNRIVQMW